MNVRVCVCVCVCVCVRRPCVCKCMHAFLCICLHHAVFASCRFSACRSVCMRAWFIPELDPERRPARRITSAYQSACGRVLARTCVCAYVRAATQWTALRRPVHVTTGRRPTAILLLIINKKPAIIYCINRSETTRPLAAVLIKQPEAYLCADANQRDTT